MRYISLAILFFSLTFFGSAAFGQCDPTLWSHVYHVYRLQVNVPCMAVTGTVYSVYGEADGDYHIRLSVDSPFLYMLNAANYSGERGKLVCEPVCAVTVTQADAVSSCTGFTNTVYIPSVGERVQIIGPYVTDTDHGWNEIHPITSIKLLSKVGVAPVAGAQPPQVKVFPNPATKGSISFTFSERLASIVYITIFNAAGRSAGQFQMLETQELKVPTRHLPDGKYFYHVMQDHNEIATGSFVVEN